ncbi:MAG TPA: nucleoside hydrolase [Candidatus Sulfomarinibacteraceae bacterium]|nr:nucleoside hydrolase [Candidatus Sulfomarinibacteraceae bacterium]
MPDRRTFIIDTDTASDDAVALVMALRHPDVEVAAITVVAGNVPLPEAVQNALYTVELCGAADRVPVHAGCDAPLARPLRTAQSVHGQDGMGDIGLPLIGRTPAPGHAVDVLVDEVNRRPAGSVTLVTLGPLTNVALAFRRDPGLAARLREVVTMGGTGDAVGNITAVAEFNIWVDPEAAAIVFDSGARLTMVGWDISRKYAVIGRDEAARLRALGPFGAFAVDIQATLLEFGAVETHIDGFDLPDPIAMAVAIDPAVATRVERLNVRVETGGEYAAGQTVVDHLGIEHGPPNVDVVLEASRERFLDLLHETHRPA